MQRAIWIVTFLIILAGAYYWVIIHEGDVNEVTLLSKKIEMQVDDINTISEEQRRLDLKYIGHGKHLQDIQDEFRDHYAAYNRKMSDLDDSITRINNNIRDLGEQVNNRINEVNVAIEDMRDEYDILFSSYRRDISDLKRSKDNMEEEIRKINDILIIAKEKLKIEG